MSDGSGDGAGAGLPADPARAVVDAAPTLAWAADATGARTHVNPAWERFTGRSIADERGDGWTAGVHPDDLPAVLRAARDGLAAGRPYAIEFRLRDRRGVHRWVLERGSPAPGGGQIGVCLEVHERHRRAERESLLADLTAALSAQVGVAQRLRTLADLLARRIGDACVIEMAGEDEELTIIAAAARDPELARALRAVPARRGLAADDRMGVRGVLRTGRAVLVPKLSTTMVEAYLERVGADAELAGLIRRRGPRSVIMAPLPGRERPLGALVVVTHGSLRLGPEDRALVEEAARRAGLMLDNARLLEEAERTAQRLRALHEATVAFSSAVTPEDVGDAAVEHVRSLLGAAAVTVFEIEDDALVPLARGGPVPREIGRWGRVPLGAAAPVADAARRGRVVWLSGPAEWRDRYPGLAAEAAERGIAAAAALPLVAGAGPVGVMAVAFDEERELTDADRDTAALLAETCAQSLARARLQRRADSARRDAELLAEVSFGLDTASGVDARLDRLVRMLVPRVADLATVRLAGEPGEHSVLAAVAGADPEAERLAAELYSRYTAPPDRPGPERVIATGEPELIEETTDGIRRAYAPDAAFAEGVRRLGIVSYLSVPMRARGAVIGALTLMATGASGRRFGQADQGTVAEIGVRAALAVDNARRYEGEQRARAVAERARGRTQRLQRVTAALSAALTERQVARVVVDEAMDALGAVAGAIVVRDGDRGRVLTATGYPPDLLRTGGEIPLDAPWPLTAILRGGPPAWFETSDDWTPAYAVPRTDLGAAGVGLPLRSGGRLVGAMSLRFGTEDRRLSPGERVLALAMAGQCAQALERAALYDAERHEARVLQRALLPPPVGPVAAARVGVRYLPAAGGRSGGDFFDAVEQPDGGLSVVVGDVVGHGVEAAAVMGQLRSAWRAYALESDDPADLAERLSRFAGGVEGAAVATVACAHLADGRLRYVCAGHPPPLLRRADGATAFLMDGRGSPMAVGSGRYAAGEARLRPGDLVLLYTDGVIEQDRDMERGMRELAELVGSGPATVGPLLDRLAEEIGSEPADDCALLALGAAESPAPIAIAMGPDASALRGAREEVRRWLLGAGVEDGDGEEIVLAVSEALANAVEHAYPATGDRRGSIRLELSTGPGRRIQATVADDGRWREPDPVPSTTRGRGLLLMRAVMDDVDVDVGAEGTTVRMTRDPARRPHALPAGTSAGIPAPSLGMATRAIEDGVLVELAGEVDAAVAGDLGRRLEEVAVGRGDRIVLDLSAVAHLGSAGVRMIVELHARVTRRGARVEAVAPPGGVARRVLELSGLEAELDVLDA